MKPINIIPRPAGLIEHAIKHFSDKEKIKAAVKGTPFTTDPIQTDFGPLVFTTLAKPNDTKYLTTVLSINDGTVGQLVTNPEKITPDLIRDKMEWQLQTSLIANMAANKDNPIATAGEIAKRLFHEKPLMEIDTSKLNKVVHPVWGELKPLSEGLKEMDFNLNLHKHPDPDVEVTTPTGVNFTVETFIPHICQLFNDLRRPEHGTDDELRAKLKMTKPFWDAFVSGRIHFVSYNLGTLLGEVFNMPAETWVNAGARWLNAHNAGEV